MNELSKKIDIAVFLKKLSPTEILFEFNLIDYKIKYLIGILAALSLSLLILSIGRLFFKETSDSMEKIRKSEHFYMYSGVVFVLALVVTVYSMNSEFFFVYIFAALCLFVVTILLTGRAFESFCVMSKNKIEKKDNEESLGIGA